MNFHIPALGLRKESSCGAMKTWAGTPSWGGGRVGEGVGVGAGRWVGEGGGVGMGGMEAGMPSWGG